MQLGAKTQLWRIDP